MPHIIRKTITQTFLERVQTSPGAIGFQFKPTYPEIGPVGEWKQVSFKEFYQQCRRVSYGLMNLGIRTGDKVVIQSNTRFEWSLSDMAILGAGGITIPIYPSSTPDDMVFIAEQVEARVMIVEDSKQLQKIVDRRSQNPNALPLLQKVVVIEPSALETLKEKNPEFLKWIITLQTLEEIGKREEALDPLKFDQNLSSAKPEDLITICYTSGTTGLPKGVMITHENLMCVLEDCTLALPSLPNSADTLLSFLPISHIFGKVESLALYVFGWKMVLAESIDKLMDNIAEVHPTLIFSVPRVFEKAYNRILASVDSSSRLKRKLFYQALSSGRRYYEAIWKKKTPSLKDKVEYQLAKALIFKSITQRFGGRLRFAICGGAPLPKEIAEFFQIVGISILEGYGLTETCAPVCLNTPEDFRFGTVGRPMPETSIKISEDGEVLIKSKKVFQGYFKLPEESSRAIVDGWFYTGDIGYLDSDGFLHITDRKKDLIVTSGGKNVAPQKIENLAKAQKLITQFVVHGDRRHYLTALVTLDHDQIIQFANSNQILFSEYKELIKHPKIISMTQRMIDEVNKQLASFETIKKFVILPNDFTIEGGELTPSLKPRRNFINKKYKSELDSMYGESVRVPLDLGEEIR